MAECFLNFITDNKLYIYSIKSLKNTKIPSKIKIKWLTPRHIIFKLQTKEKQKILKNVEGIDIAFPTHRETMRITSNSSKTMQARVEGSELLSIEREKKKVWLSLVVMILSSEVWLRTWQISVSLVLKHRKINFHYF